MYLFFPDILWLCNEGARSAQLLKISKNWSIARRGSLRRAISRGVGVSAGATVPGQIRLLHTELEQYFVDVCGNGLEYVGIMFDVWLMIYFFEINI